MAYKSRWLEKGFACRFYDEVSDQELRSAMSSFHEDPRADSSKFIVIDISDSRPILSGEALTYAAAIEIGASRSIPNIRMGLIFTSEEQRRTLEQYLQHANLSSWTYKTFTDFDSAFEWACPS